MTAKIDTRLWNLEDMIRKLGFAQERQIAARYREERFMRSLPGGDSLRVVVHPDDNRAVDIYYLDENCVSEWDASFDGSTPHAVIRATLKAAINA